MTTIRAPKRLRVSVRGVVQGVGFRPFVYQLASKHGLTGWVLNTSSVVKIEVEGKQDALEDFLTQLKQNAPPLANIEEVLIQEAVPEGDHVFQIRHSQAEEGKYQLVSPDIATCDACKQELFSPSDRRYRYPFTNCTNCGPRFTIIDDIPYDRPNTTMHRFTMCPQCQREYDDPLDRRFHAQPNACPRCGPALQLVDSDGNSMASDDVISAAATLLREGNVVALKGLGGFHLACDATSAQAVQRLRARKRRPCKPLAIMVDTLERVREHCTVSAEEERLLTSPQCPIVLLPWKGESSVARSVAPGLKYLGVMLPYTPLHHLLLAETRLPLVMTSGNISEEPIAKDNDEALRRLHGIVDYFVLHNRDIHARYDDSVAAVEGGRPQLVRRARGYAPYPIHLPFKARQVLACGAEVKNSFCMTKDSYAFVSQHVGDMENLETLEHFENTIDLYRKLFRLDPEALACDLHPDYLATKYARGHAGRLPLIPVQHHHAHIASCMVDNGLREPVIGVALDGTGYGSDGTIWGGEFLIADYTAFRRVAHLEQVPMPGGAAAIDRPYRMAFSYLYHLLGEAAVDRDLPFLSEIGAEERELLKQQLERNFNCPMTSSCGRLFDGVSAMLGIRDRVDYEGQAAVELEMAATDGPKETKPYPYSIVQNDGVRTVQLAELINAIVEDIGTVSVPEISWRFHHTMAQATAEVCDLIASESGLHRVALSGGVFQNRLMSRLVVRALERRGFQVFTHSLVPTNDGGVSLGQAVVACSSLT